MLKAPYKPIPGKYGAILLSAFSAALKGHSYKSDTLKRNISDFAAPKRK